MLEGFTTLFCSCFLGVASPNLIHKNTPNFFPYACLTFHFIPSGGCVPVEKWKCRHPNNTSRNTPLDSHVPLSVPRVPCSWTGRRSCVTSLTPHPSPSSAPPLLLGLHPHPHQENPLHNVISGGGNTSFFFPASATVWVWPMSGGSPTSATATAEVSDGE